MNYHTANITQEQETKINAYILKLSGHPRFDTAEKQEIFLKYLESMDLTKEQIKNVVIFHIDEAL